MRYVDGFVLVVPKKNVPAYRRMAREGCRIWTRHGALEYVEAAADDMHPQQVQLPFPTMIKAKPDEVVFFSFIVFKSRAHRDRVNKKVMAEMEKKYGGKKTPPPMPFDMKRMAYGGFKALVDFSGAA